jgi:ribosomal protein S18 acetylase RimI-like enzyme
MTKHSSFRIRPLRIADYGEILALWKKTEGIGLGESDSREAVGHFLKRNPGLSLVAVADARVIATLLCGHDGRRGYLHHLAVAKKWRRKGIGGKLVAACLAKLREQDIPKCNLFLYASNSSGNAFWRRLGWDVRADLRLVQRGTTAAPGSCKTSC